MSLTELSVAAPEKDADKISIYAYDGWHPVVGIIPKEHLQEYLDGPDPLGHQSASLVQRSLSLVSEIMCRKYERRQFTSVGTSLTAMRVIYFDPDDCKALVLPLAKDAQELSQSFESNREKPRTELSHCDNQQSF
jgi:hypothetical protein